jgi:integrase
MVFKPEGRNYYVVKFQFEGKTVQQRTRATTKKHAEKIERRIRVSLEDGNWGILERQPSPKLSEFLKADFQPFIETEHQTKPNTRDYYVYGIKRLLASEIVSLTLSEITSEHVNAYVAQHGHFEKSTVNRDLRTLRRALSLAVEWGKLDKMPKVKLAKGENHRERVVTDAEAEKYLEACPQPWKDVAIVILGTGMRPGEAYALDWRNLLLNGSGGFIQITQGKTRAARRLLPMVPEVYQALKDRHQSQGCPSGGWVFPTGSASGHIEESSAKQWHSKAFEILESARNDNPDLPEVKYFEPYCLRHTALTNLEAIGCDAYTLARIAGHTSIRMTERYVHPQAEAIERVFTKMADSRRVVTAGGYQELEPSKR